MLIKSICKKCINKYRTVYGEDPNDPDTEAYPWCDSDERGWRISRLVQCTRRSYSDSLSEFDEAPDSCPYRFEMLVAQGMGENDEQEEHK
jgi:hypothetical protein